VVEDLTKFGVAPISLSIVSIGPVLAHSPIISEPSGQLVVRVEPLRPNTPLYRFEVANRARCAVQAFDFEAYEGDTRILMGRRKTERNEPLILPGQEYSFELTLGNTYGLPWRTIDHIVIISVMWDDGSVDGDLQPAMQELALARSRASQLHALLNSLRAPGSIQFEPICMAFAALDRSDPALENARAEALDDLKRLEEAGTGADAVSGWVARKIAEYSAWLSRCERAGQE
jgi:hypothetical protein